MSTPTLIVITGPTGVGKSVVAMELAKVMGQPLFYFEPVLAYRELNIGSAKPSPEDRCQVFHFGLDLTDLRRPMTLADMYRALLPPLVDQLSRTGYGIVVTGSGFFLRALLQGVPEFHQYQPGHIRKEQIFLELTGHGYPTLGEDVNPGDRELCYTELKQSWPKRAAVVHANDIYRVLRSLEVARNMFKRHPDLQNQSTIEGLGTYSLLPEGLKKYIFGIYQEPWVYEERLHQRVRDMVHGGWLDEVRQLMEQGLPLVGALKSVGYREMVTYLLRNPAGFQTIAMEYELIEILGRAHRQLSRKQLKWFRRFTDAIWLNNTSWDTYRLVSFMFDLIRGGVRLDINGYT